MPKTLSIKHVALALVALGAIVLVVWAVGLTRTALSLRQHVVEAQPLAQAPGEIDPVEGCRLVQCVDEDLSALQRQAGFLVGLAPAARWLPGVGGELKAAPHLFTTGTSLAEAGSIVCDVMEPVLPALSGGTLSAEEIPRAEILRQLDEGRSELQRAERAVERAREAWGRVDTEALRPALRDRAPLVDRGLSLLQSGLSAAPSAPDLLGAEEQRGYLVLALNENERRPIGGYITGVGEVTVQAGEIVTMTFGDSYAVDDFSQPYPEAPEPLRRYMGIDLLVFRDSNWSPDFPTTARRAMDLYRPDHPFSADGVIAMDQTAVRELVDAIGPVNVPGADGSVTGETIIAFMRQAWAPEEGKLNREWWRQRKSFMGPLARAVWDRVSEGDADWVALGKTLLTLLEEKHLLVYVENPEAGEALARQGWDGALQRPTGDYLMVVDANVGYNKASAKVREEIDYQVDLASSPPQATLTLSYTHTSTATYPCEPEIRYDAVYEEMMDRCYWDYIRIYAREGSQLVDATRIPVRASAVWVGERDSGEVTVKHAPEGPWTTFGVLGLIPPSETQVRTFTWTLPSDVVRWEGDEGRYSLLVQKQPGTEGHALNLRVRLPKDSELLESRPAPSSSDQAWVAYSAIIDRDLTFDVEFGRQP